MVTPPFQLSRYFTLTGLATFAVLALALLLVQRSEEQHFANVQRERNASFAAIQAALLQEQKEAARASLIATHEAGHVTLAKVFANALWTSHLAPLVAQAQSVGPCAVGAGSTPAQQACQARTRAQVMALPAFAGIDAPVRALMRTTTVYKIKVYDLRGLTVYSSELNQVGEPKADNRGWQSALAGTPASELVHRNQFSAFEGTVKDRDLIQSYVPVAAPGGRVAGVFEIYSDVTPVLRQVDAASQRAAAVSARHQANFEQAAASEQRAVVAASNRFLLAMIVLLVLTYLALLLLVRRGQRVIDRESASREQAALREQEWHRDKMASIGAMAAHISHEVGSPLTVIAAAAEQVERWRAPEDIQPALPHRIREETERIVAMTERINAFAQAGHSRPEPLDINEQIRLVSGFLKFDRRFHGTPIDLRLAERLPPCNGIPDHLTEVLMGLLQAYEKGCAECATPRGRLEVETEYRAGEVAVRIGGECAAMGTACNLPASEPRLESARRRLQGMGGRIGLCDTGVEIRLACPRPARA